MLLALNQLFLFLGRSHDAAAFRFSEIPSVMMQDSRRYFPTDAYIVGDSAYPLSYHLLVPYPEIERIINSSLIKFTPY
jgi:hypothetical protein